MSEGEAYRSNNIDWNPSPLVALTTSFDGSQVAEARKDGSLEIWLVPSDSIGWHCHQTFHGDPESRVSSLIWCHASSNALPCGRLFSSSLDGSVSRWDLSDYEQKTVLDSIGVSIWQMAVAPLDDDTTSKYHHPIRNRLLKAKNCTEGNEQSLVRVALACDDGCVRIYSITDTDDKFVYAKSLPRASGRLLNVTWSPDANVIYSGTRD